MSEGVYPKANNTNCGPCCANASQGRQTRNRKLEPSVTRVPEGYAEGAVDACRGTGPGLGQSGKAA